MRPHRILLTAVAAVGCAVAATAVTVIALNSPADTPSARSSLPAQVLTVDTVDAPDRIETSLGVEPPHVIVEPEDAPRILTPRPTPTVPSPTPTPTPPGETGPGTPPDEGAPGGAEGEDEAGLQNNDHTPPPQPRPPLSGFLPPAPDSADDPS